MGEIHVGDIGVDIIYDCGATEDLSSATVLTLKYKKPNKTTGQWTGELYGLHSIKYTTAATGDLSSAGLWQLQPYIEMTGFKGHGTIQSIVVLPTVS